MTITLVFVMAGGAWAAGKGFLITSTKQIKPSVLKQLQGRAGARGPKGDPGSPGSPGEPGSQGPQGEPWTLGGTVPSGKTLKGEWSAESSTTTSFAAAVGSVSFVIPLSAAPTGVHYVRENAPIPAGCTGGVEEPGAEKGNLCIFAATETNSLKEFQTQPLPTVCAWEGGLSGCFPPQASRFGFGVETFSEGEGPVKISGTWAVTAE